MDRIQQAGARLAAALNANCVSVEQVQRSRENVAKALPTAEEVAASFARARRLLDDHRLGLDR